MTSRHEQSLERRASVARILTNAIPRVWIGGDVSSNAKTGDRLVADGGMVESCPECTSSQLSERTSLDCLADERYLCLDCRATYAESVVREPKVAEIHPYGLAEKLHDSEPDDLITDGGTRWADLSGFQRDILTVMQRLEDETNGVAGVAIKEALEETYEDIVHARLYRNLDSLVERDLVDKSTVDWRTNSYTLTEAARQLLQSQAQRLVETADIPVSVAEEER